MKKKLILIIALILLTSTLFAELELGLSYTPANVLKSEESEALDKFDETEQGILGDSVLGFHAGYSFWWLFYLSADSLIVPPWYVKQITSYTKADGSKSKGVKAPGFINFFDVGIRPKIGPIYVLATIGINSLYVHSEYSDGSENEAGVGANLRLGFGIQFDSLSIVVTGTSFYSSFEAMQSTVERAINNTDPDARPDFLRSLMPSIGFILHLED